MRERAPGAAGGRVLQHEPHVRGAGGSPPPCPRRVPRRAIAGSGGGGRGGVCLPPRELTLTPKQ